MDGLRVCEAIHLKPTHIDGQRMVIRVEQGKGLKDRYVMLSATLLQILRTGAGQRDPGNWLFPSAICCAESLKAAADQLSLRATVFLT